MSESIHESIKPMHSEALPPYEPIEHIGEIVSKMMGEELTPQLDANQRATTAWYGANGDRERAHTTRVFLKKPKNKAADPILCVYVDSHVFLTDMHAKRDIYLSRLAHWGFFVSGIEFSVDRNVSRRRKADYTPTDVQETTDYEVSPELQERVNNMLKDVPDSIKESISKAIIASLLSNSAK